MDVFARVSASWGQRVFSVWVFKSLQILVSSNSAAALTERKCSTLFLFWAAWKSLQSTDKRAAGEKLVGHSGAGLWILQKTWFLSAQGWSSSSSSLIQRWDQSWRSGRKHLCSISHSPSPDKLCHWSMMGLFYTGITSGHLQTELQDKQKEAAEEKRAPSYSGETWDDPSVCWLELHILRNSRTPARPPKVRCWVSGNRFSPTYILLLSDQELTDVANKWLQWSWSRFASVAAL